MTHPRAAGWKPNPAGVYPSASELLSARRGRMGAGLPALSQPSLTSFRGRPIYQGNANSCVGFGMARSIQLYLEANGLGHDVLPAPGDLYWKARREEQRLAFPEVAPEEMPAPPDIGCYPYLMVQVVRETGFVLWGDYPYSDAPAHVQSEPPPRVWLKSYDQRGLDYALVMERGPARTQRVRQALTMRMPVAFGLQVDRAFLDNRGTMVRSIDSNDVVGGHMLEVLEVRPDNSVVAETWWEHHGLGDGLVHIGPSVFEGPYVGDVQILEAAPLPQIASAI